MSKRVLRKIKLGRLLALGLFLSLSILNADAARPEKSDQRLARVKTLLKKGDYRKAAAAARAAYAIDGDPRHVLWLARVYARANRMKLARGTLKRYKALRRAEKRRLDEYAAVAKIRKHRVKQGKWPKPRLEDIIVNEDIAKAKDQLRPYTTADSRQASLKRTDVTTP